jgi:acetyl-CoA C-acetyltransferase
MPSNPDVVIVSAVRTPFGKRGGGLSGAHAADLLAAVQTEVIRRSGVDPELVGQVVTGCVCQVGMQAMNIGRTAWLSAGLPVATPAVTIDSQCGSSNEAVNLAYALIASGQADAVLACGVEVMSAIPLGSTVPRDKSLGTPINRTYRSRYEYVSQFEAAERIATQWGISRADCDEFGKLSQDRAAAARSSGAFESQLLAVEDVTADEGPRATTLEGLAGLRTNTENGVHTAGTSSQVSDGASAVLLMSAQAAAAAGATPLAAVVDTVFVGSDPTLMLTGPIPATRQVLADNGLSISDLDVIEINEAFASVVLAWERELKPDLANVNPNGGAIALGHPLGATGTGLVTKAVHELLRNDGEHAFVTMCCGGGLGTGTLLRRL